MSSFEWMELQTLTADIETARSRLQDARKRRDQGRIRGLEDEITRAEARRLQLVAHISTSIATAPEEAAPQAKRKGGAEPEAAVAPAAAEIEPKRQGSAAEAAEPVEPAEAEADAAAEDAEAEVAEADTDAVTEAAPPELIAETAAEPEAEAAPAETAEAEESADAAEPVADLPADEPVAEPPIPEPQIQPVAAAASPAGGLMAISSEGGKNMWDQLTPTDIDRAKRELGVRRAETLARHADELKSLEVEQGQIDVLEQAIASFLSKFNAAGEAAAVVKLDQERELRQQGNS